MATINFDRSSTERLLRGILAGDGDLFGRMAMPGAPPAYPDGVDSLVDIISRTKDPNSRIYGRGEEFIGLFLERLDFADDELDGDRRSSDFYVLMSGFTATRSLYGERKIKAQKKKNCATGQVCGFSCISKTKVCLADMTTKQFMEHNRAKRLQSKGGAGHKPLMSEAEAAEYVKDSVWKDRTFFHGTSNTGADAITQGGVDVTRNTSAFYGLGFYMGATSLEQDGLAIASGYARERPDSQVLEMKVRAKRPLEVTEQEFHGLIREQIQAGNIPKLKVDLETSSVNREYSDGVTKYLKSQGYDALYIKGLDYAIAFDPQQVAVYNRFSASAPPSSSLAKVTTEQQKLTQQIQEES